MLIRACRQNKQSVLEKVRNGQLDAAAMSKSNLVDDIILAMHKNHLLRCLGHSIEDKRATNSSIPFMLIMALAVAAKMKIKTSLTDIAYAIQDHKVLGELGYNVVDYDGNLGSEMMTEGSLRNLIGKYSADESIRNYNTTVQSEILPRLDIKPNTHILDCTKLEVKLSNTNYEKSGIGTDKDGKAARGYKLATLRGIADGTGILEDIRFGAINIHDLTLAKEMIMTSPMLKPGDILINDKGFLSRDVINYLKSTRHVDTYIPLKKNMQAFNKAVTIAKSENKWTQHPNKKRVGQKIAFVSQLGAYWASDNPNEDVEINACVVWDTDNDEYFVFVTTDTTQTAKGIIKTYELRPEIEEDYRQLKDFWKLEDFKSTKINMIAFHIICVLFGYLFFQLYTMLPEGKEYQHKSLPIILKNYESKTKSFVVMYSGEEFGIFTLIEFAELYSSCDGRVRATPHKGNVVK